MNEEYAAHKKEKQQRRADNRERSTQLLDDEGFDFEVKNNGAHVIIQAHGCVFDFWPGTGLYMKRDSYKGRGVFNLIKAVKGTYARES